MLNSRVMHELVGLIHENFKDYSVFVNSYNEDSEKIVSIADVPSPNNTEEVSDHYALEYAILNFTVNGESNNTEQSLDMVRELRHLITESLGVRLHSIENVKITAIEPIGNAMSLGANSCGVSVSTFSIIFKYTEEYKYGRN